MLRILIAEDLPDNQMLIEVYMQGFSHVLTFVDNGAEALEQFREAAFDLILMDVRMPNMDGLEATRAIRVIERERGAAAVPIIALTAATWPQDIELSRQAGYTAHLSKPFSMRELHEAVEAHTRRGQEPVAAPDGGEGDGRCPIAVEIPEGLEAFGPQYLAARTRDCAALHELIRSGEFERVRIVAHNIKGTGRSYGFGRLTELGAAMEDAASAADAAALTLQLAELQQYMDRVQLKANGLPGAPRS